MLTHSAEEATQDVPFQYSFGRHWRADTTQAAPFQVSLAGQSWETVGLTGVFVAAAVVLTHAPFFPADSPAGHFAQSRSLQIGRRKSDSAGFRSGSWQGPSRQIRRRRSASLVLLSFSFVSVLGGASPIRGDATILPSPEAWLSDEPGIGAAWLSGIVTGLGLLGALLCDALGTEEVLEVLNEMLGPGP
jgi:hypothetical protein